MPKASSRASSSSPLLESALDNMNYVFCGVVEVRSVQAVVGTACGRPAKTLCYDCATSLCLAHSEQCASCRATFCSSCLSFHQTQHVKAVSAEPRVNPKRKRA